MIFVFYIYIFYVRKYGKWFFGEEWVFEVISEIYIFLFMEFERFRDLGVKFGIVINVMLVLVE